MITSITLKNFRSIEQLNTVLSPSNLNVLVGANGSGKTNFVKSLEFLGKVSANGFDWAVRNAGGAEGIFPKRISRSIARNSFTEITQFNQLYKPENFPDGVDNPNVGYKIQFKWHMLDECKIDSEILTFDNVALVGRCLRLAANQANPDNNFGQSKPEGCNNVPFSKLSIVRLDDMKVGYIFEIEDESAFIDDIVFWFGFSNQVNQGEPLFSDVNQLSGFLSDITKTRLQTMNNRHSIRRQAVSLVESSGLYLFENSPEVLVYRTQLTSTRRYDFTLAHLRHEHLHDREETLQDDGENFPNVLRRLLGDSNKKRSIQRITSTLESIAPHISRFSVTRTTTGKEFVKFVEKLAKRRVESWNTSDGTLRILGFLLALETHPENSTLIIEEPERGLHPWALPHLVDHIREVIQERKLQILLTTHSDKLLDCVEPYEVLVLNRDLKVGTTLRSAHEIVPNGNLERGEIGRLWSKGLLGGVPGYEQ